MHWWRKQSCVLCLGPSVRSATSKWFGCVNAGAAAADSADVLADSSRDEASADAGDHRKLLAADDVIDEGQLLDDELINEFEEELIEEELALVAEDQLLAAATDAHDGVSRLHCTGKPVNDAVGHSALLWNGYR